MTCAPKSTANNPVPSRAAELPEWVAERHSIGEKPGAHRPAEKDHFLTPQEVAALLRVSTRTVSRLVKSGELPALRVGRSLRFKRTEIFSLFNALETSRE